MILLKNRQRFLYARDCIRSLFDYNTIPVVNENDSVAVDELKFGDNDNLSALTANLIDADLLVLFTDTDGLFDKNPHHNPDAQRISFIEKIDDSLFKLIDDRQNNFSLGGMTSKLKAAQNSTQAGSAVIITDGFHPDLQSLLNGDDIGTFFRPENRYRKKENAGYFLIIKSKAKFLSIRVQKTHLSTITKVYSPAVFWEQKKILVKAVLSEFLIRKKR